MWFLRYKSFGHYVIKPFPRSITFSYTQELQPWPFHRILKVLHILQLIPCFSIIITVCSLALSFSLHYPVFHLFIWEALSWHFLWLLALCISKASIWVFLNLWFFIKFFFHTLPCLLVVLCCFLFCSMFSLNSSSGKFYLLYSFS